MIASSRGGRQTSWARTPPAGGPAASPRTVPGAGLPRSRDRAGCRPGSWDRKLGLRRWPRGHLSPADDGDCSHPTHLASAHGTGGRDRWRPVEHDPGQLVHNAGSWISPFLEVPGEAWTTRGGFGIEAPWLVTEPTGHVVHPDTLRARWRRLAKAARRPRDPPARRSALLRHAGAGGRCAVGRCLPATRALEHRHHGEHLHARQRRSSSRGCRAGGRRTPTEPEFGADVTDWGNPGEMRDPGGTSTSPGSSRIRRS